MENQIIESIETAEVAGIPFGEDCTDLAETNGNDICAEPSGMSPVAGFALGVGAGIAVKVLVDLGIMFFRKRKAKKLAEQQEVAGEETK